jgi:hypothetical protein
MKMELEGTWIKNKDDRYMKFDFKRDQLTYTRGHFQDKRSIKSKMIGKEIFKGKSTFTDSEITWYVNGTTMIFS